MEVLVFGYLEKKWKRLIRTIWVVYSTCVFLYQIFEPKLFNDDDEIIAGIIVLIPFLISYIWILTQQKNNIISKQIKTYKEKWSY